MVPPAVHDQRWTASTSPVGATPTDSSCASQHPHETAEKTHGLCPDPFPFQIWFDGEAVEARTVKGRFKRGR